MKRIRCGCGFSILVHARATGNARCPRCRKVVPVPSDTSRATLREQEMKHG